MEFSDICRTYLGRWGDWAAFAFSLCAIFGALIVFYVLMSSFLYNTGRFVLGEYTLTYVMLKKGLKKYGFASSIRIINILILYVQYVVHQGHIGYTRVTGVNHWCQLSCVSHVS